MLRGVHSAHSDCGAAGRCNADDTHALESEVIIPCLRAWVEQRNDFSGFVVNTRQVISLVKAASVACEGEVGSVINAAVFAGTNVVDMKGSERRVTLAEPAVFAAYARPVKVGMGVEPWRRRGARCWPYLSCGRNG